MTTLIHDPLASLLARLFDEAEAAAPATSPAFADLSRDEQARLMRSKTDYTDLYARLKDYPLPVSRETGTLLYMLARSGGARAIVEFGTSFGISTLHLAAALRDNGGGRLITSEFEPSKVARARANLTTAGLADLVEIREGDALRTLAADLPDSVDLLLLDGAKGCIRRSWRWSNLASGRGLSSWPTTRNTAPTTSRTCARRKTAICRCRSAAMSSCRCGYAEWA